MTVSGYWSPKNKVRYLSLWEVRQAFSNVSIPEGMDIPEIGVYQVHVEEVEVPDGSWLEIEPIPKLKEDGKYYQDYTIKSSEE